MKVVILAGGLGTRISEETGVRPKPLIEVGNKPIIWHIMKIYSSFGCNDFIICLGYKGYLVKEFFANYYLHTSDVTLDIQKGKMTVHESVAEPWSVTLVDTGDSTMTGGRLKRIARFLDDETFCMTYGDGLARIDIKNLLAFHKAHGKEATVTVVQPPGRFGAVSTRDDVVVGFKEKPAGDDSWINGGFFVLEPSVLKRIASEDTIWEREPLESLAADDQLRAYRHENFWHPLDTLRDKTTLEALWASNEAPWRTWA